MALHLLLSPNAIRNVELPGDVSLSMDAIVQVTAGESKLESRLTGLPKHRRPERAPSCGSIR